MKTQINWHERAKQRKFCAAELWKEAMNKDGVKPKAMQVQDEPTQIHPRKNTAVLLAKNPNYFKELAAKSHKKSRENKLSEDICKKN